MLHVTGGSQKKLKDLSSQPEWLLYELAVIASVDLDDRTVESFVSYKSPPEVCPDESPSILFKSGSVHDDQFYACTQTEVVIYRISNWSVERTISIPCFNDLHHVQPLGDSTLLVVSTGLDLVVQIDLEGTVLREWSVTGDDTWKRFSRDVDYRKVQTTKHL